jgi:hypothetical protein
MAKKGDSRVQAAYTKYSALPGEQAPEPKNLETPYFNERMEALGIDNPKLYSFEVHQQHPKSSIWQPIFAASSKDDIVINYPSLHGQQETFMLNDEKHPFYRMRFNPERSKDAKYIQPANSGVHIFFPLAILEKFAAGEKIETLYMIEGEFKAVAGSLHGMDIIGLGGKDLFSDGENQLHSDILQIINKCEVENLVLLYDADIYQLNWDQDDEPDKNLAKRPNSFFRSVMRFRELAKGRVKDAYFMHVSERFLNEAKGLDDLFEARKGSENEIVKHAQKLTGSKAYFGSINLSAETPHKIKQFFSLNLSKGLPAAFYARHAEEIGHTEFNFHGFRYRYVDDEGLQMVKHAESSKFIRVGCDYFKLIVVPNTNKEGVLNVKRVPWKVGEITRDFVQKGHKNFFDQIDRYDAFCNVPDNTENYQAVVSECFNLYSKIDHLPEPGKWPNIEKYLKHVFGEAKLTSGHTNFDLALDYLSLLYLKPRQKLPILALVNRKKNTGKSTFLWLLKEMFQGNCTFIGNEELKDHLNDDWADKLIIGIDEGFIDKKSVLERLKSMSTSPTIKMRGMYAGRQEIAFFGKFVLTSNDEDNFAPIDNDEVRFWVNKVPVLTEDDPELLDKMVSEIPAFLDFLTHREILHKKTTRMWFDFELLENEALKNVKQASGSWLEKELKETLKELFFEYHYHTLAYTINELMAILNGSTSSIKFRKADVTQQLKDKMGLTSKLGRYEFPVKPEVGREADPYAPKFHSKHGRCYVFNVEDFLSLDELNKEFSEFYNPEQIKKHRATETAAYAGLDDEIM